MKIFFDTNVYIAEALVGGAAQRMVDATRTARWRIYTTPHLLTEIQKVLSEQLGFKARTATLIQRRILRRSTVVEGGPTAEVPEDPKDSPILQAALGCGADYLVTNDRHLLVLDPSEGLRIISMREYHGLLQREGLL